MGNKLNVNISNCIFSNAIAKKNAGAINIYSVGA